MNDLLFLQGCFEKFNKKERVNGGGRKERKMVANNAPLWGADTSKSQISTSKIPRCGIF